jgi:hypothetical protein
MTNETKSGWRYSSRGGPLALQAQGPAFKPQSLKKKNRKDGRKVWIKVKGNAQGPGFYLQNQREERGRRETMAQIS